MDLRIAGRTAIVCASSSGLGKACAIALSREGVSVIINGRDAGRLAAAQEEIARLTGRRPHAVAADINTEAGRRSLLESTGEVDILVNNNAGPAPGNFMDWDTATWEMALNANMLVPIMMIKAVLPGMRARKFGRIVNITSAMVKTPKVAMGLSTSARTGLVAMSKALAREVAIDNVTINNLLPEKIETPRLQQMTAWHAESRGISIEEARRGMLPVTAGRFGTPEEFGDACAFLCAAQAGYISGQSLQLDGASYAGLI